jgi:hypothetical protein
VADARDLHKYLSDTFRDRFELSVGRPDPSYGRRPATAAPPERWADRQDNKQVFLALQAAHSRDH